jgi:hypothetical protein
MWVLLSQAAIHSFISRPEAPSTAVVPMPVVGAAEGIPVVGTPELVAVSGTPLAPVFGWSGGDTAPVTIGVCDPVEVVIGEAAMGAVARDDAADGEVVNGVVVTDEDCAAGWTTS